MDGLMKTHALLPIIYNIIPFTIKGSWNDQNIVKKGFISCLIVSAKRSKQLEFLLEDLVRQDFNKDAFEIIIANDVDSQDYLPLIKKYRSSLNIQFIEIKESSHCVGLLRNKTLEASAGEFILFLDDDTQIHQTDFLWKALKSFKSPVDVIIPKANALYGIVEKKYDYIDSKRLLTRCSLFKRSVLKEIGGFLNITSYEDIELSIRLRMKGYKVLFNDELNYFHPPEYFESMKKPLAIGQSIFKLKAYYPWHFWLLIYFNALRFLPLALIPTVHCRQWSKISVGILMAPFYKQEFNYCP
jgi:cellulose synthase/poly-beta-1,6-N-acetylglucosamine synthase-like glycosyltransferase